MQCEPASGDALLIAPRVSDTATASKSIGHCYVIRGMREGSSRSPVLLCARQLTTSDVKDSDRVPDRFATR